MFRHGGVSLCVVIVTIRVVQDSPYDWYSQTVHVPVDGEFTNDLNICKGAFVTLEGKELFNNIKLQCSIRVSLEHTHGQAGAIPDDVVCTLNHVLAVCHDTSDVIRE